MKTSNKKIDSAQKLTKHQIGLVVSTYHHKITDKLKAGAVDALLNYGIEGKNIHILEVPGAFELVGGAAKLNRLKKLDGIIALGCVIKGDTDHDSYINHAVAQGLMQLTIQENKPFAFGLLTTNNEKQAKERIGGKYGNKGEEAALAMIGLLIAQPHTLTETND
jgi:6,7-dimethyl-8-ribityllumazine synthase